MPQESKFDAGSFSPIEAIVALHINHCDEEEIVKFSASAFCTFGLRDDPNVSLLMKIRDALLFEKSYPYGHRQEDLESTVRDCLHKIVDRNFPDFTLGDERSEKLAKEFFERRLLAYWDYYSKLLSAEHRTFDQLKAWTFYRMVAPIVEIFDAPKWIDFWRTEIDPDWCNENVDPPSYEEILRVIEAYVCFDAQSAAVQDELHMLVDQIVDRCSTDLPAERDVVERLGSHCTRHGLDRCALEPILRAKVQHAIANHSVVKDAPLMPKPWEVPSENGLPAHPPPFMVAPRRRDPDLPGRLSEELWTELSKLTGVQYFHRVEGSRMTGYSDCGRIWWYGYGEERKQHILERQKISRERDRLLSSIDKICHEIQTPITNARNVIGDHIRGRLADDVEGLLQALHDIHARSSQLLDELPKLVRNMGKLELTPELFDLRGATVDRLRDLEGRSAQRGIRLEIEIPEAAVSLPRREFETIIYQLVHNAIKYSPDGGTASIKIGLNEGEMHIAVHDTGFGIPESEQASIFDFGGRGSGKHVAAATGRGIGLASVKEAVDRQGGRIDLRSKEDDGTMVDVRLPCSWSVAD